MLSKEVVRVVYLAILCLLEVVEVLCCNLEHLSCTLAVACSDKRSIEVEVAVLVEIGVDGHSHIVTYAHNGTEGIGAKTQVGILTHILKALTFLLHRIVVATQTIDFNAVALNLRCLSIALALYKSTNGAYASACGDLLEHISVKLCRVNNNLYVLYCRAVVECNEVDSLRAAMGTNPSLHIDFASEVGATKSIYNFGSLKCFHYKLNITLLYIIRRRPYAASQLPSL